MTVGTFLQLETWETTCNHVDISEYILPSSTVDKHGIWDDLEKPCRKSAIEVHFPQGKGHWNALGPQDRGLPAARGWPSIA